MKPSWTPYNPAQASLPPWGLPGYVYLQLKFHLLREAFLDTSASTSSFTSSVKPSWIYLPADQQHQFSPISAITLSAQIADRGLDHFYAIFKCSFKYTSQEMSPEHALCGLFHSSDWVLPRTFHLQMYDTQFWKNVHVFLQINLSPIIFFVPCF